MNWSILNSRATSTVLSWTQAMFLLVLRVYLVNIFLRSGWLKLQSWETTTMLFEYEYVVPLLSPLSAAFLATFAEIIFPLLLLIGLAGRFSAMALLVVNVVAVISYPDISAAGTKDHMLWGWMCLTIAIFGSGRLSIDAWLMAHNRASSDAMCLPTSSSGR